jgi:hypothetical protein
MAARSSPEKVQVYDFPDKKKGKTTPYGVYDVTSNEGWVSVGTDHDTAEFAVRTIRCWWRLKWTQLSRPKFALDKL